MPASPTRRRSNRDSTARRPARPETRPVNRRFGTLGPAHHATTRNGSRGSDFHVAPQSRLVPPITSSMPPQEMANARAK